MPSHISHNLELLSSCESRLAAARVHQHWHQACAARIRTLIAAATAAANGDGGVSGLLRDKLAAVHQLAISHDKAALNLLRHRSGIVLGILQPRLSGGISELVLRMQTPTLVLLLSNNANWMRNMGFHEAAGALFEELMLHFELQPSTPSTSKSNTCNMQLAVVIDKHQSLEGFAVGVPVYETSNAIESIHINPDVYPDSAFKGLFPRVAIDKQVESVSGCCRQRRRPQH